MTLEKFLRGVCLAGIFILPFIVLYVSKSLFFPFITGKNFAFRILVEIVTGGWIALALINPAYRPKRSWLLWGFSAFVILIGISDMLGTYPHKSLWSNYERMEGWITLAHLFLLFIVAQSVLNTEKLWKQWWHTSLGVSGLVGMYGLFQLAGFITINQGGIRLDATFGNSTYLGVYMMFHIFIAALYFAREWAEDKSEVTAKTYYTVATALQLPAFILVMNDINPGMKFIAFCAFTVFIWLYAWARAQRIGIARIALVGLMILQTFILFFTSTRGAILGLIGGATLAAFILIGLAPRSRVAWRAGGAIGTLVVLAGLFWVVSDQAWIKNIEPLHRLSTITEEGIPDARQMNWGMALEGFKERPLLGWGQENYAAVFDKYYDPNMYAQEAWFDRVHNIMFDWLIAGGVLGLLAYLSLHFFALLMIWRSGAFAPYERALLTGLLAGYFFYLVFTFDNITSYLFFIALLAYIAMHAKANEGAAVVTPEKGTAATSAASVFVVERSVAPYVAVGSLVVAAFSVWLVNAEALSQNRAIIRGLMPHPEGVAKNLEYFQTATAYHSVGDQEAREQFSQAAISLVASQAVPAEFKQKFVEEALKAMQEQVVATPHNARAPFFLGVLLDHVGAYTEADAALKTALERSPKKQGILFERGLNALARGANDEAVALFKQAYDSAPEFIDASRYYAAALVRAGKDAEAEVLLREMMAKGQAADPRIASALAARNRYDMIATIWSAHVAKRPEDLEARFVLAGAYYAAGNVPKALETLEAIKRDVPSAAGQADGLIQQVKSGVKLQ